MRALPPSILFCCTAEHSLCGVTVCRYSNLELARLHGVTSFPTVKHFPIELKEDGADDKYNTALAVQGGELYKGPLQGGPLTVKVRLQC